MMAAKYWVVKIQDVCWDVVQHWAVKYSVVNNSADSMVWKLKGDSWKGIGWAKIAKSLSHLATRLHLPHGHLRLHRHLRGLRDLEYRLK